MPGAKSFKDPKESKEIKASKRMVATYTLNYMQWSRQNCSIEFDKQTLERALYLLDKCASGTCAVSDITMQRINENQLLD